LTLYPAEVDAHEQVDNTYEQYFKEMCSARATVGVCELLGGAAIIINAVE